jgi:hypothetical protein
VLVAVTGLAVAAIAFVAFTRGIGLALPTGFVQRHSALWVRPQCYSSTEGRLASVDCPKQLKLHKGDKMKRTLVRLLILVSVLVTAGVAARPTPAAADIIGAYCWGTAYEPWISGSTITFSASAFCSAGDNPYPVQQIFVTAERYKNGALQGKKDVTCYNAWYCHAESTQADEPGNQQWCTVVEGWAWHMSQNERFAEKKCETASW